MKRKRLKGSYRKIRHFSLQRRNDQTETDFSSETARIRRQWHHNFNVMEEKNNAQRKHPLGIKMK